MFRKWMPVLNKPGADLSDLKLRGLLSNTPLICPPLSYQHVSCFYWVMVFLTPPFPRGGG